MTVVELAAVAAAALMAAVVAFHVALAAELPLGATMGSRAATVDGVLQPVYRAMALGSAVVLVLAAWIVLGRAGTVRPSLAVKRWCGGPWQVSWR